MFPCDREKVGVERKQMKALVYRIIPQTHHRKVPWGSVVEHLFSMHEVLGLIPSIKNKVDPEILIQTRKAKPFITCSSMTLTFRL
jgi:hypothetical protein